MNITFTDEAIQHLQRYLGANKKMILDFDDGVGPFSAIGDCSLETTYRLIFTEQRASLPDFDQKISSNLGDIYYKGYTKPQYDDQMEVRFNPRFYTFSLVSTKAVLTDNLEIMDLGSGSISAPSVMTHDC